MDNNYLLRTYICTKKELKTMQNTLKQIEEEMYRRFDEGKIIDKESK